MVLISLQKIRSLQMSSREKCLRVDKYFKLNCLFFKMWKLVTGLEYLQNTVVILSRENFVIFFSGY